MSGAARAMAETTADGGAGQPRDFQTIVVQGGVVLLEALPLVVLAALVPKMVGGEAETPSAWAILLLLPLAVVVTRWLGGSTLSTGRRRLLGAALTIVTLQVFARIDLSESLRLWDVGWVGDLADPDSGVFRRTGSLDHLVSVPVLVVVWFRGVWLGGQDLEQRSLTTAVLRAAAVFLVGFVGGDDAGVMGTVRIATLAFAVVALATLAFKNAGRLRRGEQGGFRTTGLAFALTLGGMIAAVGILVLIVTAVIALIAGAGVAEPVTDALDVLLRGFATGVAYLFWPLIWLVEQIFSGADPSRSQPIAPVIIEGVGPDPGAGGEALPKGGGNAGAVLVRVLGGIGLILLFAVLVFFLFRRVAQRRAPEEEERESLWSEATLMDDFLGGLRSLRDRFQRGMPHGGASDAPIAELYFDVLKQAESDGLIRPPGRTPIQFARALRSKYRSDVPVEISGRFAELRYAERASGTADVDRLRAAWQALTASG